MQFALYQGRSLISGLIRRFTRSRYSHCALVFADGTTFEAIGRGFVQAEGLGVNHDPGTIVDLFEYVTPLTPEEISYAHNFCRRLVGMPYDYASVLVGFTLRTAGDTNPRGEFCSEAVLACARDINRPLQNMMPWRATPDHVAISLALKWKETITL